MITSTHNPRIQWVRKLQEQPRMRAAEAVFVVEGVRLVEEAIQTGWQAVLALFTEDLSPRGKAVLQQLPPEIIEQVSPAVLQAASDTQTPQGILAVLHQQALPLPVAPNFILIVDNLRDPGNLGTILRTAVAAGVQGVILSPGSADPLAPKVLRAAMGAHFRLPLAQWRWDEIRKFLKPGQTPAALRIFLSDVEGGMPFTSVDFKPPAALIVGGEAEGAGTDARQLADQRVVIPMAPGVESLNAAIAAAVLMYEVVRQRNL